MNKNKAKKDAGHNERRSQLGLSQKQKSVYEL